MKTALALIALVLLVAGCGGSSSKGPQTFTQFDRLGRPSVNYMLATVANNRHQANILDNPTDDAGMLANDIQLFMTGPAKRTGQVPTAVTNLLIPNVLKVNLNSNAATAGYLGIESHGATGTTFGGRALTDDVVATLLGLVFGNSAVTYGLTADDGNETAALTSDNVGPGAKHFQNTFPYLGSPD